MFYVTKYKAHIHLKSGQTVTLFCSEYETTSGPDGISSWKFINPSRRITVPVNNVSAISFSRPLWARIWNWIWG